MDAGAEQAILRQRAHHVAAAAVEQVGLDAETASLGRRLQLGPHAAGASARASAAGHRQHIVTQFRHVVQGPRVGHGARVGAVQAVDVGGDEQRIGIDQCGHGRGKVVVVAELEFVHRHGVVLVDHRQRTQAQQFAQRGACVEVAAAVAQVVVGQQHLRHRALEEALPEPDQLRLAERGQRLPRRHRRTGFIGPRQDRAPRRNRTGGDDHHLAPGQYVGGNKLGQAQRVAWRQAATIGRQQAAADLQHCTPPRRQRLLRERRGDVGGVQGHRSGPQRVFHSCTVSSEACIVTSGSVATMACACSRLSTLHST